MATLPKVLINWPAGSQNQGRAAYRVKNAFDQIVSQVTEEVERFDHCFRIILPRDEWIPHHRNIVSLACVPFTSPSKVMHCLPMPTAKTRADFFEANLQAQASGVTLIFSGDVACRA
jgi:hypothetical protein